MNRIPNWEETMAKIVHEARTLKYQLGVHDCAMFCFNLILEITGIDYAGVLRGGYNSKIGYMRIWKEHDVDSVQEMTCLLMNGEGQNISKTRRGDLVLTLEESGEFLGICVGEKTAVVREKGGLVFVDTYSSICSWSVGW